ncbi:MAG: M90 family metallopeptidase [Pseudomonadota bacterium]
MLWLFNGLRRRWVLARSDTRADTWGAAWRSLPVLRGFSGDQAQRLRELGTLFLAEKSLEALNSLELGADMRRELALQACLPVLALDLDWYEGWFSVVLYPDAFVSEMEQRDAAGVVHRYREARSGESWERGPLVLSWADAQRGHNLDGSNVVIHECAHKLDGLNGTTNGHPPLHRGMSPAAWSDAFGTAYEDFQRRVDWGEPLPISSYGAKSPAEFFAVLSEAFFEIPRAIVDSYPAVYQQMKLFYRQDTLGRLGLQT